MPRNATPKHHSKTKTRVLAGPTDDGRADLVAIAGAVNIDDIVSRTEEAMGKLPGIKGAEVWWTDADGKSLQPAGGSAKTPVPIARKSLIDRSFESGEAVMLRSPNRLPARLGAKVLLGCPIADTYQRFGMVFAHLDGPSVDAPATKAAGLIARQAAIALINSARLRQLLDSNAASQVQAQKLQNLYQVLERFAGIRSEETLLRLIPKLACTALGYNYAVIENVQGQRLSFIHAAVQAPGERSFIELMQQRRKRTIVPKGLAEEAINARQPIAINDPMSDTRIRRSFMKRQFANLAVIPLVDDDGSVAAMLQVAHHRVEQHRNAPLSSGDLELLNVFSRLCVYALASIRYSAYRRRGIDIAKIPARTVEEFSAEVVKKLPGLAGAKDAIIALPDDSGKLVPAASTNPKLLVPKYRRWLKGLEFRRYNFQLPGFPEGGETGLSSTVSLAAPILYENENLGMVHVLNRVSGTFTPRDLALMRLMTTRIGYVLKNLEFMHRLSKERQQFSSIVHNTADGILSIGDDQRIEFFNHAMEDITGSRAAEVLGTSFGDSFDPRNEDGSAFDIAEVSRMNSTAPVARTVSIRTQSGERRWVGVTATPQVTVERTKLTILVIRDITEEHQLQERQREFVSIASHEMRTPLTALIGYLSLVQSGQAQDDAQREHFVSRAYAAAARLSELVEDLLSVTRIEEGRMALNLQPIKPGEVAAEVITNLQPAAAAKHQQLILRNRSGKKDLIQADRSKFHQVLANLVDNAIKYTPEEGRITVTVTETTRDACVTVSDTGIGIHPDNLQRIFDKFFREYTELSVSAGGTGLGLFITKELVEQQGGNLAITSDQRRGTTARVRFERLRKPRKKSRR